MSSVSDAVAAETAPHGGNGKRSAAAAAADMPSSPTRSASSASSARGSPVKRRRGPSITGVCVGGVAGWVGGAEGCGGSKDGWVGRGGTRYHA